MERLTEENFTINDPLFCTAVHEVTHMLAVKATRNVVTEVSIKPQGPSLGHTSARFYGTEEEQDYDFATALPAGFVGEEMFGINDHSGTGHDMSVLERIAKKYSLSKFHFFERVRSILPSKEVIESYARSLRRQLVFS